MFNSSEMLTVRTAHPAGRQDFRCSFYFPRDEGMPTRKAEAEWRGNLINGTGRMRLGSGALDGPFSFKSRSEEGQSATNPEELIGAAHACYFTMGMSMQLSRKGITPRRLHTIV